MDTNAAPGPSGSRYEIKESLGAGGSGEIHKAWDHSLQRFVAIKRFHAISDFKSSTGERAWREAMSMASIQHPNILTIYDFGIDEQGPYVVMEFLEGETLDQVVPRGVFSASHFRDAAHQILEGLIAAHHVGLIHRDIKPQNIMVTHLASGAPQYKILDFGLAKFMTKPQEQTMDGDHAIYGSIFCLAPEQFSRQPVDARTDLYALGCVFYFMLTGRYPFEGQTVAEILGAHLRQRVVPLHERRPDLPTETTDWVMKLISVHPADRPPSADAVLEILKKTKPSKTVRIAAKHVAESGESLPEEKAAPKPRPRKSHRVQAIVGTAALLVLLVLIGLQRRSASSKKKAAAPPRAKAAKTAVASVPATKPVAGTVAARPEPAKAEPAAAQPARPAETPAPETPAAPVVNPWTSETIYRAVDLDPLRGRIGETVTLKGRVVSTRTKGNSLYLYFADERTAAASIVFTVTSDEKPAASKKLRGYRKQMVCALGVLEQDGDQVQLRAEDFRQLDQMPPL